MSSGQCTSITISVLGYREDDEWVALALEMDLRGYGATFDKALDELADLMRMQISFADFKTQPDMIFHPAAPVWFSLFAQVRDDWLRHAVLAGKNESEENEYRVCGIPVPPAHVIEKLKGGFAPANG